MDQALRLQPERENGLRPSLSGLDKGVHHTLLHRLESKNVHAKPERDRMPRTRGVMWLKPVIPAMDVAQETHAPSFPAGRFYSSVFASGS